MFDLRRFRREKKLSQKELADELGVVQSFISQIENGKDRMPEPMLLKLADVYQVNISDYEVAPDGEAVPFGDSKQVEITRYGKIIPFYDAEAAAGTEYGMNMEPARQVGMIEIGSVLRDSESAIRVYGNSMIPNYPPGCVIALKLHTDSFIEPGRVYVVETRDNRYLKRLYYSDDKASFHCLSDNQMKYEDGARKGRLYYQDFEIPLEEVIRLHMVVGVIKRNIL